MLGVSDCVAALPANVSISLRCLVFSMRNTFAYDYQISCPHVCNRSCHRLRCASSVAHPKRIARRISLTGGESCIAFTCWVANGFAQRKTDPPRKRKLRGKRLRLPARCPQGAGPRKRQTRKRRAVVLAWYGLIPRQAFTTGNARRFTPQRRRANT
jgi:hypothetical protein